MRQEPLYSILDLGTVLDLPGGRTPFRSADSFTRLLLLSVSRISTYLPYRVHYLDPCVTSLYLVLMG